MGKTGTEIFRRRVQGVWPEFYPFIDKKTCAALDHLGLPSDAESLKQLISKHWKELEIKDIEADDEEAKQRKIFVRILEHAVGAELEGKVEDVKAKAA